MKRRVYILLIVAVGLLSCGKRAQNDKPLPIKVRTVLLTDSTHVDKSNSTLKRTYMGSVEEGSNASLSFNLGGQVTGVYVSEGDRVQKGQRMISIDSSEAQSSLLAAQAQLSQAKDAYNRVKVVYDAGGVSEVKWVDVQTKLAQAQSVYDLAVQNMSNKMITAPFDGVVGELNATVGDNLMPGQIAAKVLDINNLCVTFFVPENEIRMLEIGDDVQVECMPIGNYFDGVIQDKSLIANRLSHSYKVKVRLTNPNSNLLPGMNCKVRVAQNNMQGYIIPGRAVQINKDGLYCWVVKDNNVKRVHIKSSAFVDNGVLITSGLKASDEVVIDGYQKLYNGAEVEVE